MEVKATNQIPEPAIENDVMSQERIIALLKDPNSHEGVVKHVDMLETHGAMIFLAGEFAYKIKKAVKFPYLDFSTLEKRCDICRHEFDINQPHAPHIYLAVIPITEEANGSLAINGDGQPVEWALKMKRFDQSRILENLSLKQLSDIGLARNLAHTIYNFHNTAPKYVAEDGVKRISLLIDELMERFSQSSSVLGEEAVSNFEHRARHHLEISANCLTSRGQAGFIRRCHGDLHLRNIVLLDGSPVLFDALEFDEELATTDTLYDLAFLLMDLDQRGLRNVANIVLNRYLFHSGDVKDLSGLIAMPLFLAIRAGIRSMVSLDRAGQTTGETARKECQSAQQYFTSALSYLTPQHPILICIGGFSGTGKTTLAEQLAGTLLPHAPGLVHLRSDLERKVLFNRAETDRLDQDGYTLEANKQVYEMLLTKARICLTSNQAVVIDAVFSKDWERLLFEDLATECNVPFQGLWLTAMENHMTARVTARKGDASDATTEIVHKQIQSGAGEVQWQEVDADGSKIQTLENALVALNCPDIDTNQCENDEIVENS
jgi:aminoglycoside phosphotransferase family enzyme/predicted kinase